MVAGVAAAAMPPPRARRTLAVMVEALAPHPDLGELARLLGGWEGDGYGCVPGGVEFRYRERVRFEHNGKPFVAYAQRTAALDDGRPLHAESGYWRATAGGAVELVVAHAIGITEVELGRWDGLRLRLTTASITRAPSAKNVTALERDVQLDGDVLRYELRMGLDGRPPTFHLRAELRRVAP